MNERDKQKIKILRTKANSLSMLLSSSDELKELLIMDSGNRLSDAEKVQNTARGLGFAMPEVFVPEPKE